MTETQMQTIPQAFIWRRLHSLTGLWLVVYVIFHLLTNSQAALFIGDDGLGFIRSVNSIHELPYLPVIEIAVLAFPILVHMIWGIKYLFTAKYNSFGNAGNTPYLPEYPRNHAYTWQRITSWILMIGIIAHVIHMRVIEYPTMAVKGADHFYMVRISLDDGLYTLASRLNVKLYTHQQIHLLKHDHHHQQAESKQPINGDNERPQDLLDRQYEHQEDQWLKALDKRPLTKHEVIAVAHDFGTAELLMVRDTFKMPIMIVLYTLLVLATCYHAFNGLWTFMISWGITLSQRAQQLMRRLSTILMILVSALGLSAVWLTYWINLKQ